MTTTSKKTTPERLREIRGYAERIACESASDRWLRSALCELISGLLGDDYRHPDTDLSGAWELPPTLPVPIDASSRGATRMQPPQQPPQQMRLQPATAAAPPAAPARAAAAPAAGGGGMSIEQAMKLAEQRRARAAAAAPAAPALVSVPPSTDPEDLVVPAVPQIAAAAAEAEPVAEPIAIPAPEPAPDPSVPDPAGADFLTRLAIETAAEDQQNT